MRCTRLAANTGRKKSPFRHHRTTLSGHIFVTKTCIDNRKKNLLSSIISSTCPHNMVNFGPLATEIDPVVWGTPANFNGFRILAALLHGTLVVGIGQTLRRWTEGATYIRQGDHHIGHWPTFLVVYETSRERLNGFVLSSHGRRVWSLTRTTLKVKVIRDKKRHAVYIWKNVFSC